MRTLLVLASLASLALAGCSSEDTEGGDPIPTVTDGPVGGGNGTQGPPRVFYGNGTITFSAGTPVVSFTNGGAGFEFEVLDNATLLFAEMAWEGPSDLDLYLSSPAAGEDPAGNRVYDHTNTEGDVGSPDIPSTITVKKPGDGTWVATPFAKAGTAGTAFDLAITVFYGETEVAAGYTALS